MTNLDRIKSFTAQEMAEWIDSNDTWEDSEWMKWWNENYCDKCPPIRIKSKFMAIEKDVDCSYCELEHRCYFFPEFEDAPDCAEIIKMWLNQPVLEDNLKN